MVILFLHRVFARNLLRESRRRNIQIAFCWRCPTGGFNRGLTSNKPIHYLLHTKESIYLNYTFCNKYDTYLLMKRKKKRIKFWLRISSDLKNNSNKNSIQWIPFKANACTQREQLYNVIELKILMRTLTGEVKTSSGVIEQTSLFAWNAC